MKKRILQVVRGILLLLLLAIAGFGVLYAGRLRTVNSIEQLTNYDDYNLYRMDIRYDYSIDDVINYGITDNQSMIDAILKEALPLLPVKMKAPQFGCSAFGTVLDRHIVMGRNYDFKRDTSAMLVYCAPKNGYKSVALTALDNISANEPDANLKKKLACLTAPFICLDGMNEKGVSIAVLTLDSEPVNQSTGKQKIFTTLAIRLVLDRAATTQEAVDLLVAEHKKHPDNPYMFPSPVTGEMYYPDSIVNLHKKILKDAGLPHIRFHDLRHTFATLALQNGVDVKTVSSMLGHYDAGFTLRTYTHATRQKQDEAAQTMGSFMAQVM